MGDDKVSGEGFLTIGTYSFCPKTLELDGHVVPAPERCMQTPSRVYPVDKCYAYTSYAYTGFTLDNNFTVPANTSYAPVFRCDEETGTMQQSYYVGDMSKERCEAAVAKCPSESGPCAEPIEPDGLVRFTLPFEYKLQYGMERCVKA